MKFIILLIYLITCRECLQLTKFFSNERIDQKDDNPQKVPIINVHMEEPDRDPIEVKRIEEERRIERSRIREMEMMEELDKRTFQQIIAMQNSQLSKLTGIADKTSEILKRLTVKDSTGRNGPQRASFKQKDTYSTIFDLKNGPLRVNKY